MGYDDLVMFSLLNRQKAGRWAIYWATRAEWSSAAVCRRRCRSDVYTYVPSARPTCIWSTCGGRYVYTKSKRKKSGPIGLPRQTEYLSTDLPRHPRNQQDYENRHEEDEEGGAGEREHKADSHKNLHSSFETCLAGGTARRLRTFLIRDPGAVDQSRCILFLGPPNFPSMRSTRLVRCVRTDTHTQNESVGSR